MRWRDRSFYRGKLHLGVFVLAISRNFHELTPIPSGVTVVLILSFHFLFYLIDKLIEIYRSYF